VIVLQVRTICRDYGVVCIRREGQDIGKIISDDEILHEFKVTGIFELFLCFLVWFELWTSMDDPCVLYIVHIFAIDQILGITRKGLKLVHISYCLQI
jgi:hypothetical protein